MNETPQLHLYQLALSTPDWIVAYISKVLLRNVLMCKHKLQKLTKST